MTPVAVPRIVALHRASAVSGVSACGATLAGLSPPHAPWRALIVGPESQMEGAGRSPLAGTPGAARCAWAEGADAAEQVGLVASALREMGATVVAPNDIPHGYAAAGLLAPLGVCCVAQFHGDDEHYDEIVIRGSSLVHAWRGVNRAIEARAWGVPGGLLPHGPRGPLTACVPVPERAPTLPARAGLRLLYAGRLAKRHKRVQDLACLAIELGRLGVDYRLTIAGDGPAGVELRGLLAPVCSRVEMLGPVAWEATDALIDAHDAVVLTSESEGAPIVVMQALARGRPAFITDRCGHASEVLVDGVQGIVVPVGRMDLLAQRIAGLSREWLVAAGRAAHSLARAWYDVPRVAPQYDALVREALDAPGLDPTRLGETWDAIRAIVQMIGPAAPERVAALGQRFLHDTRLAFPGASLPQLAITLPDLPGKEARRLLVAVDALRRRGASRVALYGAGQHTRKMASWLVRIPEVVAILDDAADGRGALAGLPVVHPSRAGELMLDAVVISSDEHEAAMLERARGWPLGVEVVALYAEDRVPRASQRTRMGQAPEVRPRARSSASHAAASSSSKAFTS